MPEHNISTDVHLQKVIVEGIAKGEIRAVYTGDGRIDFKLAKDVRSEDALTIEEVARVAGWYWWFTQN